MIFALAEGIVRPTIAIATAARVNTVLVLVTIIVLFHPLPSSTGGVQEKVEIIRDYALATRLRESLWRSGAHQNN